MILGWNGSLDVSHDGIPYFSFFVDSLLNPSDDSFDDSSDVPSKVTFLGGPIEEAICGS